MSAPITPDSVAFSLASQHRRLALDITVGVSGYRLAWVGGSRWLGVERPDDTDAMPRHLELTACAVVAARDAAFAALDQLDRIVRAERRAA